jgi:hypothetical protein
MVNETLEAVEIIRSIHDALPKMEREGRLTPGELPLMHTLIDVIVRGKPAAMPIERFSASL